MPCRIIDGEKVGYYFFISISSGERTFHFIDLIIFGNYWKERDEKSPTNEVTLSYCGLFSDVACIGGQYLSDSLCLGCLYICNIDSGDVYFLFYSGGE